ncbi:MAG: phage holin family protein [Pseudomonadota bacterium]
MERSTASVTGPGLIAALAGLARNGLGLFMSRIELAALELSEAREHALALLAVFALATLCAWFALAYTTAMIVVLCWASMGWLILLLLALLFAALTGALVLKLKAMLAQGKLALPETMNELKNDRDMLL